MLRSVGASAPVLKCSHAEQETLIARKLESGQYASACDVVRDALRLLEAYDEEYQAKLTALRAEIQKGIDSGPGIAAAEVRKHMRDFIARETKGLARKWREARLIGC